MESAGPSIADHALLGDGRSAALVARDGAVDWLCWPRFDSPAVFARLLDPAGGAFVIAPATPYRVARRYLPDTNVLETRFACDGGEVVLLDFMTVAGPDGARDLLPERELLRIARCTRGEVKLDVTLDPRPGFGKWARRWHDAGRLGLRLESGGQLFTFRSEPALPLAPGGGVRARLTLRAGESARFSFSHATEAPALVPLLGARAEAVLRDVEGFWRGWAARTRYHGPFRDAVVRSALALKLLVYAPSGAIVAAPTTSLPERVGGPLNWDYRFCWLRDASLTVRALLGLGHDEEAEAFVGWLLHSTRLTRPALSVLYDVFGRAPPPERELPFAGYRGSAPVRVGNAAVDQLQLDVYGEVADAVAQLVRRGRGLDRATAGLLAAIGDYVVRHWDLPDDGIWEPREGRRHRTHSKALCWAALDRLLELHARGHLPRLRAAEAAAARAALRERIERDGWSDRLVSYTAAFGEDRVDAALLQLPWFGYVEPDAPRMRATFRRIEEELSAGRALLYRYRPTAGWEEGAFGICGFWAAEYLAMGGGSAEEAEARLGQLLAAANDVGLFAEELDAATGEALGNFPQAFTHVGLVNACLTLQERLTGARTPGDRRRLPSAAAVEATP